MSTVRPVPLSTELEDLAYRVLALVPDHRDPEQYHIRKSEISARLKALARAMGDGSAA